MREEAKEHQFNLESKESALWTSSGQNFNIDRESRITLKLRLRILNCDLDDIGDDKVVKTFQMTRATFFMMTILVNFSNIHIENAICVFIA